VLVGSTAGTAVAVTVRALGSESTARAALPFAVLFPGAIWVGVSADGLFAGVLAWGVALLATSAARPGLDLPALAAALGGGLLLGATLFLSYGLVLAGLLPLAVALTTHRLAPLLVAGAGVASVVAAFAAAGFWWLDGYRQVVVRYYQPGEYGLERPYGYWVWADLACLAVVLGPAGVAGLRRALLSMWRALLSAELAGVTDPHTRGWRCLKSIQPAPLCVAALIAVIVADLSGLSKAEVERIWLPFAVWLVAATGLLPQRQARWWLAAQALLALAVNHLLLTTW
jgi:hypothetical protein